VEILMPMRMRALLFAVSGLAACEREPTPIEFLDDQIVLQSVITAGETQPAVLLLRMDPATNVNQSVAPLPGVPGATVMLSDGTTSFALGPNTASGRCNYQFMSGSPQDIALAAGCYTGSVAGGVRAGATYTLDVLLPDGRRIHGSTVVPALPPAIRSPASGDTLHAGPPASDIDPTPILVSWTTVVPAPLVHLAMFFPNLPCYARLRQSLDDSNGEDRIDATGRDSVTVRITLACDQSVASRTRFDSQLVLTIFDESYARYQKELERSSGIRSRYASVGITGALGVFGSAATVRRPLVLVWQN
jgi:hypothetical protein